MISGEKLRDPARWARSPSKVQRLPFTPQQNGDPKLRPVTPASNLNPRLVFLNEPRTPDRFHLRPRGDRVRRGDTRHVDGIGVEHMDRLAGKLTSVRSPSATRVCPGS